MSKELLAKLRKARLARHNRWLQLYSVAFGGLALSIAWLTLSGPGIYGAAGFGRALANLINLVILIVPLMGLTLGASSIAREQERGSLAYLLTQPISRLEVLLGKYMGLAFSLMDAVTWIWDSDEYQPPSIRGEEAPMRSAR